MRKALARAALTLVSLLALAPAASADAIAPPIPSGDAESLLPIIIVLVIVVAAAVFIIRALKKRRQKKEDEDR